MSMTTLYFITMLDKFNNLFLTFVIISSIVLFFAVAFYFFFRTEVQEEAGVRFCVRLTKIFIPIFSISIIFFTFLPSTKQAVFIYMAEGITNNEDVKQIPKNTIKFLNLKLKEYIQDQEIKMDKTK